MGCIISRQLKGWELEECQDIADIADAFDEELLKEIEGNDSAHLNWILTYIFITTILAGWKMYDLISMLGD